MTESPELTVPQLRMRRATLDDLPAPTLPDGYSLRSFRDGDEDAWIGLLNTGQFGPWNRDRLAPLLAGERVPVPRDGVCFAVDASGALAGATCVLCHPGPEVELGWVIVHPDHRGRGLCRPLCAATLEYARSVGYSAAFLKTEDYRPAAIRAYLRLGFEPEMIDPSHPDWWQAFRAGYGG